MQGFEISREESSEVGAVSAPTEPPSSGGGSLGLAASDPSVPSPTASLPSMSPAVPASAASEQAFAPAGDRRIGQVIDGKYHVLRRLACGGMGSVYEARHAVVGRHVALKFLHEQYAQRSCMVQRFLREAQAAGSIASENIIGVLDYGTADGTPYLVMELVRGQDLREILAETPRLPAARAVRIVIDACRGLALAHERGLVHRDLKPANICVTRQSDGREVAKVIDFGVAKLRDGAELSEEGTLIGTLGYMAPEQLTDQKQLDARADIYALGVILYQALAGRPPHICNRSELLYRIVSVDPKPLGELCPELPPALCAVVHKALFRNKERRYTNVADLALALEPFAQDARGAAAERVSSTPQQQAAAPTRYEPATGEPGSSLRDEPTSPSRLASGFPPTESVRPGVAGAHGHAPDGAAAAGEPPLGTRGEPGWTTFTRDGQHSLAKAALEDGSMLGTAQTELGSSPTWAALTPTSTLASKAAGQPCERVSVAQSLHTDARGLLLEQYCRHPDGLPPPLPPRHHHMSQRALLLSVGALALSVVAMTTMFIFVYSHGSGALESAATAASRATPVAENATAHADVSAEGGASALHPPLAAATRSDHCEGSAHPLHGASVVDLSAESETGSVSVQQHSLRPGLGAYPGVRAIACE
jgi:serine/threonine protein kinase